MKKKHLTVTALTKYIKRKIDTDPHLKNILIQGEISNFNHHSRGHMYFTLKDDQTRIQAVMFAGQNRRLKFTPENGMSVLIKGDISVFESFGQYQLYVNQMEPDGIGSLYLAFEQLKEKLQKQGLFDEQHKRPMPLYPSEIGIITSPTGAAIQDILTTLESRYPIASTTIFPALVQGERAANSIASAIKTANNFKPKPDLLIVGRGGGSIEELWPFNEEIVARAIFNSKIPIISAIGHETDITISDYVSDVRAPTPTGAAVQSVPSYQELLKKINHQKQALISNLSRDIKNNYQLLQRIEQSYAFRYPEQLVKQKEQELDQRLEILERNIFRLVANKKQTLNYLQIRLKNQLPEEKLKQSREKLQRYENLACRLMAQIIKDKTNQMNSTIEKLSLLSPLHTIKRGFAIPYTEDGTIIKSHNQIQQGEQMTLELHDSYLNCKIMNVREKEND